MLTRAVRQAPDPFIVDGLIYERTANLVVGDSGIGKTPFLTTLSLAVSSGLPFFGKQVKRGPVLYFGAEMTEVEFEKLQQTISGHLGLAGPPGDFYHWSLYSQDTAMSVQQILAAQIAFVKPSLVVIDPLRAFFPLGASKAEDTSAMIRFQKELAQKYGCAWVTVHHVRKTSDKVLYQPDLANDPMVWLQEAAGSRALVNHTDLRMGIEAVSSKSGADLRVGGFRRGAGKFPAFQLGRKYNDAEEPVGYELLTGVSTLDIQYQTWFMQLPSSFRFKDVREQLCHRTSKCGH